VLLVGRHAAGRQRRAEADGRKEKGCEPAHGSEYERPADKRQASPPPSPSRLRQEPVLPMHPSRHFSASYQEARSHFLDAARSVGAETRACVNPVAGPAGETLATDVLRVGPADAERVLVTISGTHGVEGYCGSG